MFETALKADARRKIRQIGKADIVVGIPSYRNAKTIAGVVEAAATGLVAAYPDLRAVLVNVDGGSSDGTPQAAAEVPIPRTVKRIVTGYFGMAGKGSAVRAVFQIAHAMEAQACVILDADLMNLTPLWIRALASPILSGRYEYATPYYTRPRTEAATIDLLAYPLSRMLFGRDVRQPTGSEFALSVELAGHFADKDVWETDVARAGIGAWMTTVATQEGRRMCQVALGTKQHEAREPSSTTDQAFAQMVGTVFRMAYILRRIWLSFPQVQAVPIEGDTPLREPDEGIITEEYLLDRFRNATKRQRRTWKTVLLPSLEEQIEELLGQPADNFQFPDHLWAQCVGDFLVVYNKGEADPDRVVNSLIPLCCARQLAFLRETEGMSVEETEGIVRRQAEAFIAARPYLFDRWETYVPWAAAPGSGPRKP